MIDNSEIISVAGVAGGNNYSGVRVFNDGVVTVTRVMSGSSTSPP